MAGTLTTFLRGREAPRTGRLARRISAFDDAVEAAIAPRRGRGPDRVFYALSSAADHGLLWLSIGAVRAATSRRHGRSFLRLALAMGAESALTNGVVKTLFRRVRPPAYFEKGPLPFGMHRPITSAFPSGHAATGFTAATLLAEDDPLGPAYYALAALVAASRTYVGMHHPSDVIAGSTWGLTFGRLVRRRFPLR